MIKVNVIILLLGGFLCLTACTIKDGPSSTVSSTFQKTDECATQLIDITSSERNFVLAKNNISRSDLIFSIQAESELYEIIKISSARDGKDHIEPVGTMKVNKRDKTILNSTFGDIEYMTIKLDEHPNFVKDCF